MRCVDDLLALTGLTDAGRSFDWAAVERGLGLTLPADYKEVAERFPDGRFQGFLRPIRPGDMGEQDTDFLGYYRHRLDDLRRWRADEPQRFPHPLHPEPGGLLPWAVTHRADLFFWRTDTWSIVASDSGFEVWEEIPGTVCDLLTAVLTGTYDAGRYGVDLSARAPWFELPEVPQPPPTGVRFWQDLELGRELPHDEFAAVAALLGPGGRQDAGWAAHLPQDYRRFVESYGLGSFGDVAIAVPLGLELPEVGGPIVAWGATPDGWTCAWARSHDDPDRWGTVLLAPDGRFEYAPGQSFSSFLLAYADPHSRGMFVGRTAARPSPIRWVPR
jgi:hypothetical protein